MSSNSNNKTKSRGKKADQLIELVKGKTLFKDAPLTRNLILELYGFDITTTDNNNKGGDDAAWQRDHVIRSFSGLVRDVRRNNPEFQFYIVEDENRQRHCVHIIDGVNEDLLLKQMRHDEKVVRNIEERSAEKQKIVALGQEERERLHMQEFKQTIAGNLIQKYCNRKQIKGVISELSRSSDKKLPLKKVKEKRYKPNYKGIQYFFGVNAVELRWEMIQYNEDYNCGSIETRAKLKKEFEESLAKMLKDIIIHDYERKYYHRTNRKDHILRQAEQGEEPDYLGIRTLN